MALRLPSALRQVWMVSGHRRFVGDPESPREAIAAASGTGDADPRTARHRSGRVLARRQGDGAVVEDVRAIGGTSDAQRRSQTGGPAGELTIRPGGWTPMTGEVDTLDDGPGTDQRGRRDTGLTADHVEAPVHAIGEIYVEVSGGTEHHCV